MMNKIIWVDSLIKLSIISDPIKCEIFKKLRYDAFSAKKLSYKMSGISPQSIHYHLHLLLEHQFIYKKFEERKRSIFETYYQAIAPIIRIDQKILNLGVDSDYYFFSQIDSMEENIAKKQNENHRLILSSKKNQGEKAKHIINEHIFTIEEK